MKWVMMTIRTVGLFFLFLGAVVALSPGSADAAGGPPPPSCFDFITGGGWFAPTTAGPDRANFGFEAGYKNGPPPPPLRGEANYIDHNTGMHFKATSVDTYFMFSCASPCEGDRVFKGDAQINGVPGYRYTIEVIDAGEPGNVPKGHDRFIITINSGPIGAPFVGYSADSGGYPGSGPTDGIDGGNIQLHKACTGS